MIPAILPVHVIGVLVVNIMAFKLWFDHGLAAIRL